MKSYKRFLLPFLLVLFSFFFAGIAWAGFIDFENGVDGQVIASSITGLEFTNTAGYNWLYADWRTGDYNGPYPNGPDPLASQYWSAGNFFAWLGTEQGAGVITFTQSYATYFKIGYSSFSNFYIDAYDTNGTLLDSASGGPNLDTGRLDYLRVDAPGMAYVICHDTGNFWLVDNLETDAIQQCTLDIHCDDGIFCNGEESCIQYQCKEGIPVSCSDDGLFCNGSESCSNEQESCVHSGDPCLEGVCNEKTDTCDLDENDDDDDDDDNNDPDPSEDDDTGDPDGDEELWPEGKVSGGCSC